ncbi:ABC transporter ATP-binding protein [Dialister sp.]|uniref:ABC transporter ATP-binding protein n=1 Tax=Dialister sp. TaxID=1955814 RepID=UPI002E80DB91|nr:ATP-binding cassette domain-containing protein [Dialister sp.]MEE3451921.1 ATP-binding cassette domain-containing protein [Dialister sp.]
MMVNIRDFSCRYESRKTPTLSHISFSADEGEMVLIAGLSGCGKSTLIKAVTGLLDHVQTEGHIYLNDKDTASLSAEDIGLIAGTVYQTPDDQLFAMTIEDEVGFALENRGEDKDKIRSEVKYALEKVGLGGMEKKSIYALSGGQRQRLVLASILVTHPRLLILDEPVSQMNPQGVQDFIRLLLELNRKDHMTILMVEHRVNELARWFPRLCVMHEGHFIYDGPVEEAWNRIENTEIYGLREPQAVKLCRKLGLKPATSDLDRLADMIQSASIHLLPHIKKEISKPDHPFILEGKNIHFTYPGTDNETLHGLDLNIRQGTINALMGFNGAGKSTLLDILAGLENPTSGQILFRGKPAEEGRNHVGFMRQEADLMLLADTVEEELTWNNPDFSEEELVGLLERLHVSQYRKDFPLALSKGQRLRVVFGAMLARKDNELLLLDEPTTGQDQKSLHEIKEMLLYAASEGRTIFICTHDIELASELADEVFVMKAGNFIAHGSPHDIFSDKKLMEESGLAFPPMMELSEKVGIEPCITIGEVMNHVVQTDLGGR